MKVEDVYKEVSTEPLVGGRKYIQMELGGSCKDEDDTDFQMPTLNITIIIQIPTLIDAFRQTRFGRKFGTPFTNIIYRVEKLRKIN